jgi:hypothetical protein
MINADRLGKRAGTRSDAEFAAEERGCSTSFLPPPTSARRLRPRFDQAIRRVMPRLLTAN